MTFRELCDIYSAFCEHITWTNYGGPVITLLGRDIGVFICGYLTHMVVSAFIEVFSETKGGNKKCSKK